MGCLIGPKIMGPNCGIFGDFLGCPSQSRKWSGCVCGNLSLKSYVGMYETMNSYGNRFQKVKPRLDEWAARGQPTVGFQDC